MATSSITNASSLNFSLPNFTQIVSKKLENSNNYLRWLTQVHPALCSHELVGIVDGSEPCPPKLITDDEGQEVPHPKFVIWTRKDQYILSWITMTLFD